MIRTNSKQYIRKPFAATQKVRVEVNVTVKGIKSKNLKGETSNLSISAGKDLAKTSGQVKKNKDRYEVADGATLTMVFRSSLHLSDKQGSIYEGVPQTGSKFKERTVQCQVQNTKFNLPIAQCVEVDVTDMTIPLQDNSGEIYVSVRCQFVDPEEDSEHRLKDAEESDDEDYSHPIVHDEFKDIAASKISFGSPLNRLKKKNSLSKFDFSDFSPAIEKKNDEEDDDDHVEEFDEQWNIGHEKRFINPKEDEVNEDYSGHDPEWNISQTHTKMFIPSKDNPEEFNDCDKIEQW